MRDELRITCLAVSLLLAAAPARANPVDAFGLGARAPAMGGAGTAASDDTSANYYNPAALAAGDVVRIDVGYQAAKPWLSMNGGDQGVNASRGLVAGLAAPGRVLGARVAIGVAVFLPDERITRARTYPVQRPRWALYDNRPQRIFIGSHLAVRVTPELYVGGGIAYMAGSDGDLALAGRVGFPDAADSDMALAIDFDLNHVRYPQAGVLWRARPWLDVGVTYRGGFTLTLREGFHIEGDVGAEGRPPVVEDGYFDLRSVALDLFQPDEVAAGFAARLSRRLLVAGDITWYRWSAYDNPGAHVDIGYDLKDFNDLVTVPPPVPLTSPRFHDIFVPRLGAEVRVAEGRHATWLARAGYAYEPSPAPEQTGETNFVDCDKHTLSAGAGVSIAGVTDVLPHPFDVDLYVAATWLPDRPHRKISPVDPVGDYVSDGHVLAGGLVTRWRF